MKKRHSAEQIVLLLREADVEVGKGEKGPEVCRKLGITQQTYYRWRTKYGSIKPKLAKQLRELQRQVKRLTDRTEPKQLAELSRRKHSTAQRAAQSSAALMVRHWRFD